MKQTKERRRFSHWLAREVLPCEPRVRAWIIGCGASKEDADDLIQEAYCRFSQIENYEQIDKPEAYFRQTVRNLRLTKLRRAQVVRIDSYAEIDSIAGADPGASPEVLAGDRIEIARIERLVDQLPDRCRTIFRMRKIEGRSQKEISAKLGLPETIIENDSSKGLRIIMEALRREGEGIAAHYDKKRRQK